MNRTIATSVILPACCGLALIGGASARLDAAPVAGTVTLGVTTAAAKLVATGWRATQLMDADVYNDRNQKIGEVGDFVVAPDGSVSVAILDVGGFLGLGTHQVAIPVDQFSQVEPKIVLPGATENALKQLPEFRYNGD